MAGKTTNTKKSTTRRATPAKVKKSVAATKESPRVTQERPLFSTGTWVTIVALAVLIGFTFYLNSKEDSAVIIDETPVSAPLSIFTAIDGNPTSIEVKSVQPVIEIVKIKRNAENAWAIVLPFAAEADQGLAEAAASQISALQIISPIEDGKPANFGLDHPAYIITIEFDGGTKHTLEVGDSTPSNSGYYVRLDKSKIIITDLSGIDSLLQLGAFPPFAPTPTPLPPTEVPAPATDAAITPETSVTPAP